MPKGKYHRNSKYGLRVTWHDKVIEYERRVEIQRNGPGWYIEVFKTENQAGWRALMELRFARQKDADWAMRCLQTAGINSFYAIIKAGPEAVLRIATQDLQW